MKNCSLMLILLSILLDFAVSRPDKIQNQDGQWLISDTVYPGNSHC
jgi:hypothetical protein